MPLKSRNQKAVDDGVKNTKTALEQIPFVDFTTTLVRGVIETLVDTSIEQMEAYADLLGVVAPGLSNYQSQVVGSGIKLVENAEAYLDSVLDIDFNANTANTVSIDSVKRQQLVDLFEDIYIEEVYDETGNPIPITASSSHDGMISTAVSTTDNQYDVLEVEEPTGSTSINLSKDVLRGFAVEQLRMDAKSSYDKLEAILRMGLNRLVFQDITLESKLTFHLDASEFSEETSSTYDEDLKQKAKNWGVKAFFGASGNLKNGKRKKRKKIASGIVNRSYGGYISGGTNASKIDRKLKVTVMNEKAIQATNMNIDILGHVKIHARSDFFPLYDPDAQS